MRTEQLFPIPEASRILSRWPQNSSRHVFENLREKPGLTMMSLLDYLHLFPARWCAREAAIWNPTRVIPIPTRRLAQTRGPAALVTSTGWYIRGWSQRHRLPLNWSFDWWFRFCVTPFCFFCSHGSTELGHDQQRVNDVDLRHADEFLAWRTWFCLWTAWIFRGMNSTSWIW